MTGVNRHGVESVDPRARFVLGVDNEGRQHILIPGCEVRPGEHRSRLISCSDLTEGPSGPLPNTEDFVRVIALPDTVTIELPRHIRDEWADDATVYAPCGPIREACKASWTAELAAVVDRLEADIDAAEADQ